MPLLRLNRDPSGRQLAVFGAAWTIFLGGIGRAFWVHGHPAAAALIWGAALAVPLAGSFHRRGLRAVYLGLGYATYPIGFILSHLALAAIFFGVITPIGLVLRLCRHDPLTRRFDRNVTSYWSLRPSSPAPETYFRQS